MAEPMTELVDKIMSARSEAQGKPRGVRVALAAELAEYGVLSRRQIGLIVDENPIHLQEAVKKEERTGGRFSVDALEYLHSGVHLVANGNTPAAIEDFYKAWRLGTSIVTIQRLSGLTLGTLRGRLRKMAEERASE